eukprot:gnl/TRDRNA2_/TRDRNA2_188281_c0_seq1.p2 gnl/TRDRNA2_/TRDRNA2_188281_c0~~gnl/TRDRNA2_/TRDRNA2_188281_c0_seq1.p2  ORF type:complete len:212 (+),score=34.33 gnl/TRDRNA2_/TRDRNA2_188281_c0_seq1:38-637(+)
MALRESLDLDPERPAFLSGLLAGSAPPKKPRICSLDELEPSSVLSAARSFLLERNTEGSAAVGSSADPKISPLAASDSRLPGDGNVILPRQAPADDASDSESSDELSDDDPESAEPCVEVALGLGVFDVGGDTDVLLRRGVPEAAGCLPGDLAEVPAEKEEAKEELPLIQELSPRPERPAEGEHARSEDCSKPTASRAA